MTLLFPKIIFYKNYADRLTAFGKSLYNLCVKQRSKYIIAGIVIAVAIVAMIVVSFANIPFSDDETASGLIQKCITELCGAVCALAAGYIICGAELFRVPKNGLPSSLFWCIPCLICVLANFPYSALICKTAQIERVDLIWIFTLYCLFVGIFEEFLFRGICQKIVYGMLADKKYKNFLCVLFTALIFACWHLFNLTSGNVGATLLQVGYSFLIGAMLSAVRIRSGNIYICVILHAVFDFGGLLIPTLGSGVFQDATFWILTAICGVLCFGHVTAYLILPSENSEKK